MTHTRTDPICQYYREPRTWLQTWWFNRRRGYSCRPCMALRGNQ